MGNTRVAPYSYCLDAHAGLHADLISWEMVRGGQTPPTLLLRPEVAVTL